MIEFRQAMNTVKTILLLGLLSGFMITVGYLLAGRDGMIGAFILALATNIGSYWFSAPMALAMSGARPISAQEAPELYEIVGALAEQAHIPMPSIHLINDPSPNAFATGRNPAHAAVAVTTGILQILDRRELAAVLAHELGHVRNSDILISTIAATLAAVVTSVAHWGFYMRGYDEDRPRVNPFFLILLTVLAPIAAMAIQMGISRAREFEADNSGAHLCGDPLALASALAKVSDIANRRPLYSSNPAISSLYLVHAPGSMLANLFSTHPPIEERISRLRKMAEN